MAHSAVMVNRDVRLSASNVDQHGSEFLLVLAENCYRDGNRLEHSIANKESATIHRSDNVLRRCRRASHDMDVDFETCADHAKRIADPILVVNSEFLRQDVNDFAVRRERDGARRFDAPPAVIAVDLAGPGWNRCHTTAIETLDVRPGQPDVDGLHLAACHGLCLGYAL